MNQSKNDNAIQTLGLASYEMSTSINLAQRAFRTLMATCLGHHGLTIPQWTLLGRLYKSEPARPIKISQQLGIKPPYIAKLINELEDQELIVSLVFPDDGRGKAIALTAKGINKVETIEVMLEDCLNGQLGSLKTTDLETYFALTKYIANNVKHHDN